MPVTKEEIMDLPSKGAEDLIHAVDTKLRTPLNRENYRDEKRGAFIIPYSRNDTMLTQRDQKYVINAYLDAGWNSVAFDEDDEGNAVFVLGFTVDDRQEE